MIIIGITGNIGTGKSTVSKYLQKHHHLELIDADEIVQEIWTPHSGTYKKIVQTFQPFVGKDVEVSKESVGNLIFEQPDKRALLNRITHGVILRTIAYRLFLAWLSGAEYILLDAPLLYETGLARICSVVIVVSVDESIQFSRLQARDGHLSDAAIRGRMAAQWPLAKKAALANIVLNNNGTLESLQAQLSAPTFFPLLRKSVVFYKAIPSRFFVTSFIFVPIISILAYYYYFWK